LVSCSTGRLAATVRRDTRRRTAAARRPIRVETNNGFPDKLLRAAPLLSLRYFRRAVAVDVLRLPLSGRNGFIDVLARVGDRRWRHGQRYRAPELLAGSVCAVLSGARSFIAIWQWLVSQPASALLALGFRRGKAPSESALRRFLHGVNAERFSMLVGEWFAEQLASRSTSARIEALAGDGKTLRGSVKDGVATQLVSLVAHDSGVTVGQQPIDSGNEIGAMRTLLDAFQLAGKVVTFDSLHTQRETAFLVFHVKQADYVMTVKGNQPTLLAELENTPAAAFSPNARAV
jgi:hypothetical protein